VECFRWVQTALPSGSCCPPRSWHAFLQAFLSLEVQGDVIAMSNFPLLLFVTWSIIKVLYHRFIAT
jgi:hypothetical protein